MSHGRISQTQEIPLNDPLTTVLRPTDYPRVQKRYVLPERCDVSEIVLRELTGQDELLAAIQAEHNCPSSLRGQATALLAQERTEGIRLSLIAVDGRPIDHSVPYRDLDQWSSRTRRFVAAAFDDLNGVTAEELGKLRSGGVVVPPNEPRATARAGDAWPPTGNDSPGTSTG